MSRPLTGTGLAVLLFAGLLPMADAFIVNVSLPTIATSLAADNADLCLVVAGYGIAFTVFLTLGGRLGDAYGRRTVLLFGLLAFTAASMVCAFAPTTGWLIGARVAQGAAAALIPPQVLGTISATTPPERRPRSMSGHTAVSGLAAMGALFVGGLLTSVDLWGTSWRLIFLVNLPVGIAAVLLTALVVPETRSASPAGIDPRGTGLLAAAGLLLLVPLNRGPVLGWPWWTVAMLVLAPAAGYALWRVEAKVSAAGRAPLLPPSLLATPAVRRGLLTAAPFLAAWAGCLYALPLTLQRGFGLDPLWAGLVVVPLAAAFLAGSLAVPALRAHLGERATVAGALAQAGGVAWLLVCVATGALDTAAWTALPGLTLIGFGQAVVVGSTQISVLAAIPTHHAAVGGGVLLTTQQGAMTIGVTALGSVFGGVLAVSPHSAAFGVVLAVQLAAGLAVLVVVRRGIGRALAVSPR
ncbi:MFS transporter [Actinokineospora sp. G85]|uniref:MFS transporter n=1 Tax=Actinokineospora sp. G85 TaxID=3406626 RepID=UPI003C763C8C